MGQRIPASELARLKQDISVQRLVESSGVPLEKSGKAFVGTCPFHADALKSLSVEPVSNVWRCSACNVQGGPVEWVSRKNGVSARHAVELLREGVTAVVPEPVKRSTVRALEAPFAAEADERALFVQVMEFYHHTLKQSPEALAYLEARGIGGNDAINTFKLGFANRTLGLRLPTKGRKEGREVRERLERLGLYRATGHEHFNGAIVFPVLDMHGQAVHAYGRKIGKHLHRGDALHLELPPPHQGIFNEPALAAHSEIILCKGVIDALTFWCAGYQNVTCTHGANGFTDAMLDAFKRHRITRVLLAQDRSAAGERAAQASAAKLMAAGIECFRIRLPKWTDVNSYAMHAPQARRDLGQIIRNAVWIGAGAAPSREPPMPQPERVGAAPLPVAVPPEPLLEPEQAPPPRDEEPEPPETTPPEAMSAVLAALMDDDEEDALEQLAEAPPLAASPMPTSAPVEIAVDMAEHEVTLQLGDRRYRVRGLGKNLSFEIMKVNLMVTRGEAFYVDSVDLYSAKQRANFITAAAFELHIKDAILKTDLGRVLLKLEQLQDDAVSKALQPKEPPPPTMTDAERDAALALLRDPALMQRIAEGFAACGLIGEEVNKLVGYLASVSRKLDKPLGVVIQSSSAAGKTALMDAVLAFVPHEEKVKYSAMTGQSLFYMGVTNLRHKALAIVEEEGARHASYALKLLQSEGELTIASTGKDPASGNLITQQYRVEGPVSLLVTTTARDLDEELLNRCLVLTVDEGRDQTRAIHQLQRDRRTLTGLLAKHDREGLLALHRNAQRLLRPLDVLNPYAAFLTFPDQTTRLRRDHEKYLTLIDTIAFLHQHQRPIKREARAKQSVEYIEATLDDIALANRIAHEVLGRSLDELPPQSRRLLRQIDAYVSEQCALRLIPRAAFLFTRRQLREAVKWGDTQLKLHLARLVELEYLAVHRTHTGAYEYELVYDVGEGDEALRFPGLADIDALKRAYDASRSGLEAAKSAPGRAVDGAQSPAGHDEERFINAGTASEISPPPTEPAATALLDGNAAAPSNNQPAAIA